MKIPQLTLYSMGKNLELFPKIRNNRRMSILMTSIQNSARRPSDRNKTYKKIKGIQISKEEVKLSLLADNMILYVENPKESTKTLLGLINEISKLQDTNQYRETVAFLNMKNEIAEREIKKTILFTTSCTKIIKHVRINLTKGVHSENYKTLMNKTEEDTDRKAYHDHGLGEPIL